MEQAAGIYIDIGPIFIHASRDGAGDELFVLAVCPRSLFHFQNFFLTKYVQNFN